MRQLLSVNKEQGNAILDIININNEDTKPEMVFHLFNESFKELEHPVLKIKRDDNIESHLLKGDNLSSPLYKSIFGKNLFFDNEFEHVLTGEQFLFNVLLIEESDNNSVDITKLDIKRIKRNYLSSLLIAVEDVIDGYIYNRIAVNVICSELSQYEVNLFVSSSCDYSSNVQDCFATDKILNITKYLYSDNEKYLDGLGFRINNKIE